MLYLLNNCRNVDHLKLYGGDAFFDFWIGERDEDIANEMRPGDTCWVASYKGTGKVDMKVVVLAKYRFSGIRRQPSSDAPGGTVLVLEGHLEHREILPKPQAAEHSVCWRLFNKAGHFKQISALRSA